MTTVFPVKTATARRVMLTNELTRIAGLPRRVLTPEQWEVFADRLTQVLKTPHGQMRLRPVQAVSLLEMTEVGGVFGPQRCGAGKTLLSLLSPSVLQRTKRKGFRPLLVVPAGLLEKTERDRRLLAEHWEIVQFLKVMSYEWLGRPQAANALEEYQPDLIILDECHKVRNTRSAVCRRFKRFFQERSRLEHILGPGGLDPVACIAMSGTVTKRSLFDYAHIMRWCLPASHIPIPWHFQDLMDWADALDEKKERKQRDEAMTISSVKSPVVVDPVSGEVRTKTRFNHGVIDPGELKILCNDEETALWDSGEKQRAARLAFRRRLIETPGVVATVESPIDASLLVRGVKIEEVGESVENAFEDLRTAWVSPDGVALWDGLEVARKARELALGFFYTWWNEDAFKQCLTNLLRMNGNAEQSLKIGNDEANALRSIAQRILNDFEHTIGNGTDVARALAILKQQNQKSESGNFVLGTGSQTKITTHSSRSTMGCATSAARGVLFQVEEKGEVDSVSITITSPEKFAAFFAVPATERWLRWVTILRGSRELFNIFSTAVEAAGPPEEWLGPRKVWAKFVRETLKHSKTFDSESQVRRWVHELSADPKLKPRHWTQVQFEEACAALLNWVEVRDSFEPNTVPVWIDTTALNYAASWCQQHRGIAWVEHTCFGERLEKDFGITYYGRKGRNGAGYLIDDHSPSQSLVASIAANKEGRNLQAWSENLIVSMPSSGLTIEQLISRTHRDGQEADEVLVEVIVSCWEHVNAFNQASADADYIQSSTGAPQKLMLAGVDFPQLGLLGFGRRWIK